MKKENNSFKLIKLLKKIFIPEKSAEEAKRERHWMMYRND